MVCERAHSSCSKASNCFENVKPMQLSVGKGEAFQLSTHCHICKKIYKQKDIRCRDLL